MHKWSLLKHSVTELLVANELYWDIENLMDISW